jgi:hypothetical protein
LKREEKRERAVIYCVGCEPALNSYAHAREFMKAVADMTGMKEKGKERRERGGGREGEREERRERRERREERRKEKREKRKKEEREEREEIPLCRRGKISFT